MSKDTNNYTDFRDQPVRLDCGGYECDDDGVVTIGKEGRAEQVIAHPLTISRRLTNIDTGITKLELAFRLRHRPWKRIIVDHRIISSTSKITDLSDQGILISGKTGRKVMDYLMTLEERNQGGIPEALSCTRLGYLDDGKIFSPYDSRVSFDGDSDYKGLYDSVRSEGTPDGWREAVKPIVATIHGRITMASSFASVLVKLTGENCFYTHLWSVESGTGKTVCLMGAASIWANPELGKYIRSFDSTTVGRERLAMFLNSLPVIMDELQLSKDKNNQIAHNLYWLTEGSVRTRGKQRGMEAGGSWRLSIITSGESPIVSDTDAAGAKNRAIEIEAVGKLVPDGNKTSSLLRQNYGHAGKEFVNWIMQDGNTDLARMYYGEYKRALLGGSTDKQAGTAALILTADYIANGILGVYGEELRQLLPEDIIPFLKTKQDTDTASQIYTQMCDWVRMNLGQFEQDLAYQPDIRGRCFGAYSDGIAYIYPSLFRETVKSFGGVAKSFLKWLAAEDLLEVRDPRHGYQIQRRIGGESASVIAMIVNRKDVQLPDSEIPKEFKR